MISVACRKYDRLTFRQPLQWFATGSSGKRSNKWATVGSWYKKRHEKSEWWIVDGEMHEIGENVPPRERFVIPRDNLPNRRRKQLRDQFMRKTRLVLKDSEHEPWCRKYMELYQELRENWERLYWDEGYSKKIAQDHAKYDSAEDDDDDFSPYRRQIQARQSKGQGSSWDRQEETSVKANQIRDKFEYDRERRMREKAFAPMRTTVSNFPNSRSAMQTFGPRRMFNSMGVAGWNPCSVYKRSLHLFLTA